MTATAEPMSPPAARRADVRPLTFSVRGIPVPQGALVRSPTGGLYNRGGSRLEVWRGGIRDVASRFMGTRTPMAGAVSVRLVLTFPRLTAHFRTGRHRDELRPDAPRWMATVPDADKCARSCLDALSGVAFRDDRQVARLVVEKQYGDVPGVFVSVEELAS